MALQTVGQLLEALKGIPPETQIGVTMAKFNGWVTQIGYIRMTADRKIVCLDLDYTTLNDEECVIY